MLPSPSLRTRGAQPGNHNARRHGLYSALDPSSLSNILKSLPRWTVRSHPPSPPAVSLVYSLRALVPPLPDPVDSAPSRRQKLAALRLQARLSGVRIRLISFEAKLIREQKELHFAARSALALIQYSFAQWYAITRDADSFREFSRKSDKNSSPDAQLIGAFLTDDQWAALAPLIPGDEPVSRFGRPPRDPRLLLDAIFWKLSTGSPWAGLPSCYPSVASCRNYYRRLFLSGRLFTLERRLYHHLRWHGVSVPALLENGCFFLDFHHHIALHPDCPPTWKHRTALLLMRQGYEVIRRIEREAVADRRRRGSFYRPPSIRRRKYPPRAVRFPPPNGSMIEPHFEPLFPD